MVEKLATSRSAPRWPPEAGGARGAVEGPFVRLRAAAVRRGAGVMGVYFCDEEIRGLNRQDPRLQAAYLWLRG